ncbi:MAG: glucose-1-phosphate cytidylyltransferase [Bdellovibrio sp.]
MEVVILCGGMGTRLAEETSKIPKPMVTVGQHPILWHIMNIYAHHGFNKFNLALGYKADVIKDYFLKYRDLNANFSIDLATGNVHREESSCLDWKVNLMDTGLESMTGGRVRRFANILRPKGTFMLTYGDGVANVDIKKLVEFHKSHGKLATVTAVRPIARFGGMKFEGDKVASFKEKAQSDEGWINGGFFVFEPEVFDYLENDQTILEREPLEKLTADGQLMAYKHDGFWQCMDTIRDRQFLEELWASKEAPWKVWK